MELVGNRLPREIGLSLKTDIRWKKQFVFLIDVPLIRETRGINNGFLVEPPFFESFGIDPVAASISQGASPVGTPPLEVETDGEGPLTFLPRD